MHKVQQNACAGTLESSDIFVQVFPQESGITIELNSDVKEIYGDAIHKLIFQTLKKMEIENVRLVIHDKGALDFVIKARLQTALLRAMGKEDIDWSKL
jgi:citrate lyase subunit gamma (acyl carrier protein)